jgi:exodeoxyribonuclease VII large subunit
MSQMPLFEPSVWTVSDLTRYLRDIFEGDPALQNIWISGEVSNLSRPTSGHLYFTIKDRGAALRCVMWRNQALRQAYLPQEGAAIEVFGSLGIYDAGGNYQLYAELIRPVGEGTLYQEFLRLKARLESEGLFDPERKRPLPEWPRRIGIVTSASGAALRDILNVLQRRYPLVEVILAPTAVQGDEAPPGIVKALQLLNSDYHPDVILLARGGGSAEDLWAFNDERVARAISASEAPVVSGVGHETDFTIADFVADLRAPTPTAAAELTTPDAAELALDLVNYRQRLLRLVQGLLTTDRQMLRSQQNSLQRGSPLARVRVARQRVDELGRRSAVQFVHGLRIQRARLSGLSQRLEALNPQAVLGRGYAIVRGAGGAVIRSAQQVKIGDRLDIQVADGQFPAEAK